MTYITGALSRVISVCYVQYFFGRALIGLSSSYIFFCFCFRDRSQTLVRGAWCKKISSQKCLAPSPFWPQNFPLPPFFLKENYESTPQKIILTQFFQENLWSFFSSPPPVITFKDPFFASDPLLTSACEWSFRAKRDILNPCSFQV